MEFCRFRKRLLFLLLIFAATASANEWADSYLLEGQGQYSRAIQAINPILKENPDHEFALLRTAWLRYLNRDYNASIRDYRRALEVNRDSLDAQLGLTLPLLAQARWREAAEAARKVLSVAPWNYYAHLRLLVAEEGEGRWDTLATHANEVAKRFPADATILVYLARAEARRGNTDAAVAAYRAVMERYPEHAEATAVIAANSR